MKINISKIKWKNDNWKLLCPIIHMVISALFSALFFRHDPLPFELMLPARDIFYSQGCERTVHILMSLLFGFLLICIIWHILFLLIEKKRKFPFLLVALSFVISVLVLPGNFTYEPDNLLSYSFAVRNIADYWQSVYLGCLYRGALYVFPHPMALPFIQLTSLIGVVYYISERVRSLFGKTQAILTWLVVLLPEFWEIGINPYRNCIYTIMSLWFFSVLFFDCIEKKKRPVREVFFICFAGAFLSVFRSEGIIAAGVLLAALLMIYKVPVKKLYKLLLFTVCVCVTFSIPQKLGEKKYYGKDYSMINNMNILKDVLSDKNVNLEFDTAEEDLKAINRIVPLEGLMIYGIQEYRANNFVKNNTVNQSFASKEEQDAFIKGARDIILHNPGVFLKNRLAVFCEANGISSEREGVYPSEEYLQLYATLVTQWNYSYEEIITDSYPVFLFQNEAKIDLSNKLTDVQNAYYGFVYGGSLFFVSRILIFLLFPVLILYDIRLSGKKERIFFAWTELLLLVQLAAIILFSPEGRRVYYYAVFYVMLLGCFLLSLDIIKKSRAVKEMLPPVTNKL